MRFMAFLTGAKLHMTSRALGRGKRKDKSWSLRTSAELHALAAVQEQRLSSITNHPTLEEFVGLSL